LPIIKKFNKSLQSRRVLVAPLNWGLGHATRCIPLIQALSANGCDVLIAVPDSLRPLFAAAFPGLRLLPIPGYKIRYSKQPLLLPLTLLFQLPRLCYIIWQENRWLKQTIQAEQLDAVISDNRFGLWNRHVPTVFITHQLSIQTGFHVTDWLLQRINYGIIKKYDVCWVPDAPGTPNLAGRLSHPAKPCPIPLYYLGPLSRFAPPTALALQYDLLVLLSGPEPQRTLFETKALTLLQSFVGKALLVRGLPGGDTPALPGLPSSVTAVAHLPAEALRLAILQSATILCRSGYTTIMDLVLLQKTAILVPTPGQTEQEYLADYLEEQGLFTQIAQRRLSLAALQQQMQTPASQAFPVFSIRYIDVIRQWLAQHEP
jgi:hypothetical protein